MAGRGSGRRGARGHSGPDLDDLQTLNDVQAEFFGEPHPPRSTYGVAGLPPRRIELTAVAKRR